MEIILLRDVAKVGKKDTVVTVSEGYALNFLIPKGMAKAATPGAMRDLEANKSKRETTYKAEEEKIAEGVRALDGKTATLRTRLNEQGHVFAALKPEDIATAIYNELGVLLPPDTLGLKSPIKEGGEHTLSLSGGGATGKMTLMISDM
ncbi:MAG: 50S ribosomal protein L9 [Patescibacteria group bacterium]